VHFVGGFLVTYFMDWLLSDTPYALDNKDRIIILTVWPLVFVFVIIMIIIEFWKND
jgi:hypothetical protein